MVRFFYAYRTVGVFLSCCLDSFSLGQNAIKYTSVQVVQSWSVSFKVFVKILSYCWWCFWNIIIWRFVVQFDCLSFPSVQKIDFWLFWGPLFPLPKMKNISKTKVQPNFQKVRTWQDFNFQREVPGKEGVTFFRRSCNFHIKVY